MILTPEMLVLAASLLLENTQPISQASVCYRGIVEKRTAIVLDATNVVEFGVLRLDTPVDFAGEESDPSGAVHAPQTRDLQLRGGVEKIALHYVGTRVAACGKLAPARERTDLTEVVLRADELVPEPNKASR
ncbi:hypothetical protein [Tahibacter amnicola]|uniref:Uncharacterized protein n=1 Tax=Tahibacter amnicola TaxID=2976241 RepID=A0ABY6BJH5_9GAMM|nr:hypothetical protein [Tahibacter amnicola]UXI70173.1 hypothetical protein N4264_11235 [Tahibacter amnicola]